MTALLFLGAGFILGALVTATAAVQWLEQLNATLEENVRLQNANNVLETENLLWQAHTNNVRRVNKLISYTIPKNPENN